MLIDADYPDFREHKRKTSLCLGHSGAAQCHTILDSLERRPLIRGFQDKGASTEVCKTVSSAIAV